MSEAGYSICAVCRESVFKYASDTPLRPEQGRACLIESRKDAMTFVAGVGWRQMEDGSCPMRKAR